MAWVLGALARATAAAPVAVGHVRGRPRQYAGIGPARGQEGPLQELGSGPYRLGASPPVPGRDHFRELGLQARFSMVRADLAAEDRIASGLARPGALPFGHHV